MTKLMENCNLYLNRISTGPKGTFGVLTHNDVPLCVTLEEPWKQNLRGISCIPVGSYKCVPHTGMRFKHVWRLEKVPNRTAVLIHQGNTLDDTEGCILVGKGFDYQYGSITDSKKAMDYLRSILPDNFNIHITEKGL